jgi:hypothetical protein
VPGTAGTPPKSIPRRDLRWDHHVTAWTARVLKNQGQCIKFVNHLGKADKKGKDEDKSLGKNKSEKKGGKKK